MKFILNLIIGCVLIASIGLAVHFSLREPGTQEKLLKQEYQIITIQEDSIIINYIK